MRVSYRDDAAFLLRLEAAVLKDTRQTEKWRKETGELVHALALRLLSVKMEAPVAEVKLRQAR
jgi:hypothetical protein